MQAVLPSKFRMVRDDNSNGFKLVNTLYGVEFDIVYSTLDDAVHANRFDNFDYSTDYDINECYIRDEINGDYVYGDGNKVRITNKYRFYSGSPTRVELDATLVVSGVSYGPIGLEYMRTSPQGSGRFIVNLNVDSATAFQQGMNQTVVYNTDIVGNVETVPSSGYDYGLRTQNYQNARYDEVLVPPTDLRKRYPLTRTISAPEAGSGMYTSYQIDHYTPYKEYVWDPVDYTYKAVGFNTDYYYDSDTGEKIYYRTAFNNPYGTGVFDTVYMELNYVPISGTLQLWDIDNLTASGTPWEVPQSGLQSYQSTADPYEPSGFPTYIGYYPNVPTNYLPLGYSGLMPASTYKVTSWDYAHVSGGLNEQFEWVEYPDYPITSRIRIDNPISRYLVTYKYKAFDKAKYLSTINSTKHIRQDDGNYIYTIDGGPDELVELDVDFAKETKLKGDKGRKAIVFKGTDLRPGAKVTKLEIDVDRKTTPKTLTSNETLSLDKKPAGSRTTFTPSRTDHRQYLINEWFDDNIQLTQYNTGGLIYTFPFGNNYGARMVQTSGTLGFYSGEYFSYLPYDSEDSNRYVRARFSYINPPENDVLLWQSSDGSGEFWSVTLRTDGSIQVLDQGMTMISTEKADIYPGINEIIVERQEYLFDNNYVANEFNIYHRLDNNVYNKLSTWKRYEDNDLPSGPLSWIYYGESLDVQLFQVYDEPRQYTELLNV